MVCQAGLRFLPRRGIGRQRVLVAVGRADDAPLRMLAGGELVPLHRDVDRALDVGGAQRLDHVAQQVGPRQLRMRLADLGRVVRPAVVALGEDGDRVDVRPLQRRDEIVGIERRADRRDVLGGVEVEVDLAIAERLVGLGGHVYSLEPERRERRRRRTDVGRRGRR